MRSCGGEVPRERAGGHSWVGSLFCVVSWKRVCEGQPLEPAGGMRCRVWARRHLVCASGKEAASCEISFLFFYFSYCADMTERPLETSVLACIFNKDVSQAWCPACGDRCRALAVPRTSGQREGQPHGLPGPGADHQGPPSLWWVLPFHSDSTFQGSPTHLPLSPLMSPS